MELAKVTSKGQITIPIDIRRKLGIKEGDKVLFMEENGKVILMNSALAALQQAQQEFTGEAQRSGLIDEQDVVDLVAEMRRERGNQHHADHA